MRSVEAGGLKKTIPDFNVGDTVSVHVKIVEDEKTRIQAFEGIVIARKGSGLRASFTVRKISFGEGVERIFPVHSPSIDKITVVKKGSVNRAKLYYLRGKVGKATRVDEKLEAHTETGEAAPKDAVLREEGKKEGV
ncbi:MAG: 50S ribosomal protein L19 [Candidatus Omnitrophica bacterium]|nr:50S ribosomal protein L19 [Candidatus Omnitrophota bacterium]